MGGLLPGQDFTMNCISRRVLPITSYFPLSFLRHSVISMTATVTSLQLVGVRTISPVSGSRYKPIGGLLPGIGGPPLGLGSYTVNGFKYEN